MAVLNADEAEFDTFEASVQLRRFYIDGLFGYLRHEIHFPQMEAGAKHPEILIIEGQNGTGKTTILKMISGIVTSLDFTPFRVVPFNHAELELSNGDILTVDYDHGNPTHPIIAGFRDHSVSLALDKERMQYTEAQTAAINAYRSDALPLLNSIAFDLLTIDRSIEVETK